MFVSMSDVNHYYILQAFPESGETNTQVKIFSKMVSIHTPSVSDQQFKVIYNFMQKYNYKINIEVNVFHQMMITLEAEDLDF